MENINLVETFSEFKEFKNIDRETMMRIIEDIFRAMLEKKYGSDDNFDIIVNIDKGDLEIWRNRTIVEDGAVEDDNTQIAYSEAIKIEPDFEIGEDVSEEIKLLDDYYLHSRINRFLKSIQKRNVYVLKDRT